MKRLSLPYLCAIPALVLVVGSVAAQFGGSSESANNSAKKSDKPAAEKASTPAASNQAKTENVGLDFCQCTQDDPASAARIERTLASPLTQTGMDYADVPLKDIAEALTSDYDIPVQLDRPALEEAGVEIDTKVNISLHNISLRSALRLMLKTLGLTSIVQDEVLLITTKEAAEQQLKICVYDARKVISDASDKNVQSLIETITACIGTDTWAKNGGGQAEIRQLPAGLIVVTQTQAVHQEIHNLLATVQRMSRK
jgi:hypothetical protein